MRVDLPEHDGIVFLVDATDPNRSPNRKQSLLIDKAISNLKPILVLVQKPDASGIANKEILNQELCLEEQLQRFVNLSRLRSMHVNLVCSPG